jgi:hypothetical protein
MLPASTNERVLYASRNHSSELSTYSGLGVCTNHTVLAEAGKRRTYVQTPENREWVTIIECVSAKGDKIRPAVIFRGVYLQTTWLPRDLSADFAFTTSKNAWTNNDIALEWLKKIFIPETARNPPRPRLLVLDGHKTHATLNFMIECHKNGIILNYFPSHTSHIMQPLDLSCFSPVKGLYRKLIRDIMYTEDAAAIKKHQFIKTTIQAGFYAAGIEPHNPEKGLKSSQI